MNAEVLAQPVNFPKRSAMMRFAHVLRTCLRRLLQLILMQFINAVGALSQPGQQPSGRIQAWALRRMGVDCPSNDVWFGFGSWIDHPRRIHLGNRAVLGPGTHLTAYGTDIWIGDDFLSAAGLMVNVGTHDLVNLVPVVRPVVIGRGVWCGTRVTICSGVTVGDNAIIGAGSVVVKNLPANHVSAGVPCKPLRPVDVIDRASNACWSNFRKADNGGDR